MPLVVTLYYNYQLVVEERLLINYFLKVSKRVIISSSRKQFVLMYSCRIHNIELFRFDNVKYIKITYDSKVMYNARIYYYNTLL